jgi:hypothetical protein
VRWTSAARSRRCFARKEFGIQRSVTVEIKRVGSQASAKGPSDWLTGTVRFGSNRSALSGTRSGIVQGPSVTFVRGGEPHDIHIRLARR